MVGTRSRRRPKVTDFEGGLDDGPSTSAIAKTGSHTVVIKPVEYVNAEAADEGSVEEGGGQPDSFSRLPKLREMLARLQKQVSDPTVLLQPSNEVSTSARLSAQVGIPCTDLDCSMQQGWVPYISEIDIPCIYLYILPWPVFISFLALLGSVQASCEANIGRHVQGRGTGASSGLGSTFDGSLRRGGF